MRQSELLSIDALIDEVLFFHSVNRLCSIMIVLLLDLGQA